MQPPTGVPVRRVISFGRATDPKTEDPSSEHALGGAAEDSSDDPPLPALPDLTTFRDNATAIAEQESCDKNTALKVITLFYDLQDVVNRQHSEFVHVVAALRQELRSSARRPAFRVDDVSQEQAPGENDSEPDSAKGRHGAAEPEFAMVPFPSKLETPPDPVAQRLSGPPAASAQRVLWRRGR